MINCRSTLPDLRYSTVYTATRQSMAWPCSFSALVSSDCIMCTYIHAMNYTVDPQLSDHLCTSSFLKLFR